MNKSEIYQTIYKAAQAAFGSNLVGVAVGGSILYKEKASDIDTLVVVHSYKPDQVEEYTQLTDNLHVSVRAVTKMMFDNKYYDGKVATMLYKGMVNLPDEDPISISFEQLQKVHKPLLKQNLSELQRALASGKISKDKAIDLLIQLLVISDA